MLGLELFPTSPLHCQLSLKVSMGATSGPSFKSYNYWTVSQWIEKTVKPAPCLRGGGVALNHPEQTESHFVNRVGLKFPAIPFLCVPSPGMTGPGHHSHLNFPLFKHFHSNIGNWIKNLKKNFILSFSPRLVFFLLFCFVAFWGRVLCILGWPWTH